MVDRVHGNAAVVRTLTQPALAPSLAKLDVGMLGVGNRAHRRHAGTGYETLLARIQAQNSHSAVTTHELCIRTGRTSDLSTLAGLELDVVNDRAHRDGQIGRAHV